MFKTMILHFGVESLNNAKQCCNLSREVDNLFPVEALRDVLYRHAISTS
jgi:hypothetical protein